jgi:hypothetical protein
MRYRSTLDYETPGWMKRVGLLVAGDAILRPVGGGVKKPIYSACQITVSYRMPNGTKRSCLSPPFYLPFSKLNLFLSSTPSYRYHYHMP